MESLGQKKNISRKNLMKIIFIPTKQEIMEHVLKYHQIMATTTMIKIIMLVLFVINLSMVLELVVS
jgi:hypothetical protein